MEVNVDSPESTTVVECSGEEIIIGHPLSDEILVEDCTVEVEDCTVEVESSDLDTVYLPVEVEVEVEQTIDIGTTEELVETTEDLCETFDQTSSECKIEQDLSDFECVYIKEEEVTCSNESDSDSNTYYCQICGQTFFEKSIFKQHMSVHNLQKSFACAICNTLFSDSADLKAHMETHSTETEFACSLCDKTFKKKFSLDYHMLLHTTRNKNKSDGNNGEREICTVCNKSFQKAYMKAHLATHQRDNEYSCTFCGKYVKSKNKQSLYMHMCSVHVNEGSYKCSFCDKRFFWKSYLDRHVTVHTKEKSHHCTLCSKAFTRKLALRKHMATHVSNEEFCLT